MALPLFAQALTAAQARIAAAARRAGRDPGAVELIAVSKTHPAARVEEALAAGHTSFGENRVQEAAGKFPALRSTHPGLRLHLIGPLQSNKTAEAVALFDVVHTLDRAKLAEALAKEMAKQRRRPSLFIQVNTGEEPQKAGVAPAACATLLRLAREELRLPVVGLMCIPPVAEPPAPHFALLAKLARDLDLPQLSMGMSGDFEAAVELGATQVRLGSALFGGRA